ncbi:MAG: hypothetical protein R2827_14675 [Bdellovibrionales bacterium]
MNIISLDNLHHRSKKRVKDFGEVFTPEKYVENMLDLLAKNKRGFWADENISFFEPCCGHGNIVVSIYKRRLEAIYKKSLGNLNKEAPYYSVANSLNTLWAIDLDSHNVEICRTRVLAATLAFLRDKVGERSLDILLSTKKDFFAHIISAIQWHIDENETLSALSNEKSAKLNAQKTRCGSKWFLQNGHHELDFNLTWVDFYEQCEDDGLVPLDFERAVRLIDNISSGKNKGFEELSFAKIVVNEIPNSINIGLGKDFDIGA